MDTMLDIIKEMLYEDNMEPNINTGWTSWEPVLQNQIEFATISSYNITTKTRKQVNADLF